MEDIALGATKALRHGCLVAALMALPATAACGSPSPPPPPPTSALNCSRDTAVPTAAAGAPLEVNQAPPASLTRELAAGPTVVVLDPFSGDAYEWDTVRRRMLGPAPRQAVRMVSLQESCPNAVMPGFPTPVVTGQGVVAGSGVVLLDTSIADRVALLANGPTGLGMTREVSVTKSAPKNAASCSTSGCSVHVVPGALTLHDGAVLGSDRVALLYSSLSGDVPSQVVVLGAGGGVLTVVQLDRAVGQVLSDMASVVTVSGSREGLLLTQRDSEWRPIRTVPAPPGFSPVGVSGSRVVGAVGPGSGFGVTIPTSGPGAVFRLEAVDLGSGAVTTLSDPVATRMIPGTEPGSMVIDAAAVWWAPLGEAILLRVALDGSGSRAYPICSDVLGLARGARAVYASCSANGSLTVQEVMAPDHEALAQTARSEILAMAGA